MSDDPDDAPHPIDIHVGAMIRMRRRLAGQSQERLGAALGVSAQLVQKYERAANRISTSKLSQIAMALEAPVTFFFDGYRAGDAQSACEAAARADAIQALPHSTNCISHYRKA